MNINPTGTKRAAPAHRPADSPRSATVQETDRPAPKRRRFWILISLAVLAGAIFILSISEDTIDVTANSSSPPLPPVTVEEVSISSQTIEIRAFAEVQPRWSATLSAGVSGRVEAVRDSALAGERVKAGTALIEIENSRYLAELAAAELAVKEAELALWRAKNATRVARADFKRNGTEPPNELALKLPQLNIAESAVASATARLTMAEQELAFTSISAPFEAFVTERFVSPGEIVNVGDQLIRLTGNAQFELVVELGESDWALLGKPLIGQTAKVADSKGDELAQATIRSGGGFLDGQTRQYKVFLDVKKSASNKILSGDFVTVLLPGITVASAFDLPASALTQEGVIWHLDSADRLQKLEPKVLFRRHDRVVIAAPAETSELRVAVTPLVSFLPGQSVQPHHTAH